MFNGECQYYLRVRHYLFLGQMCIVFPFAFRVFMVIADVLSFLALKSLEWSVCYS